MNQSLPSSSILVDRLRDQHMTAVNASDIDGATGIFAPEGVLLPPGAPALAGTAAIRAWFAQMFGIGAFSGFTLAPNQVDQHGDLWIEHGAWKATMTPHGAPGGVPTGGTYLTVYARTENGVRVIRDTFNGLPG